MKKHSDILSVANNGELIYHGLNSQIKQKYKPDTPLDKSFIPYVIMIFCAVVDASVFISLFQTISFDSPLMLAVQVSGFLFAFDIVPIYIGIQLKRIKQGLTKDKFIMWLAIFVCISAFIINIVLRITTIDQMSPDTSSANTNYFGTVSQETTENSEASPVAIAMTIFGIGLPMLTSIGSFFISYLTYNPLLIRKKNQEYMLYEKDNEIRRFDAYLLEYEEDELFAENLIADDTGKHEEMQKMQKAVVTSYCDLVRQRLKEHLGNPTSTSALSSETCVSILNRLDQELSAINKTEIPSNDNAKPQPVNSTNYLDNTEVIDEEPAYEVTNDEIIPEDEFDNEINNEFYEETNSDEETPSEIFYEPTSDDSDNTNENVIIEKIEPEDVVILDNKNPNEFAA